MLINFYFIILLFNLDKLLINKMNKKFNSLAKNKIKKVE